MRRSQSRDPVPLRKQWQREGAVNEMLLHGILTDSTECRIMTGGNDVLPVTLETLSHLQRLSRNAAIRMLLINEETVWKDALKYASPDADVRVLPVDVSKLLLPHQLSVDPAAFVWTEGTTPEPRPTDTMRASGREVAARICFNNPEDARHVRENFEKLWSLTPTSVDAIK
ncbi:MAG: hypothetical protein PHW10_04935 [Candidatus Peribacteraceae bacterium]|nr:hypothetical protein [Candidatus Peribacteraceae bacterium]